MEKKMDKRHRLGSKKAASTLVLAEMIPFYPKAISSSELAKKWGIASNCVDGKLNSCQEEFLICSDGNLHSRMPKGFAYC